MPSLSPSDVAIGDLLVDRQVLSLPQLDEATALAQKWQVRLGDAVLSRNWIEPAAYYRTLAQHFSLPFLDLSNQPPDPALLSVQQADAYNLSLSDRRSRATAR